MSQLSSGDTSGLKSNVFFILLWSQEPWDLSSSPWEGEESLTTFLSNSEFQHPANRDQDQLGARYPVWDTVGAACLLQETPECLGQIRPHGEMGPLLHFASRKVHKTKFMGKRSNLLSEKIQCVPHHLSFHSLQSSAHFSSLPYLGLRFIWCQAFVFTMQVLFLVRECAGNPTAPPIRRRPSTPGWCFYCKGRQEPYTWSSAPGSLIPFRKMPKGMDQKHRHLQRMATGHHHWFPSASHCQALSSVPLEHCLT